VPKNNLLHLPHHHHHSSSNNNKRNKKNDHHSLSRRRALPRSAWKKWLQHTLLVLLNGRNNQRLRTLLSVDAKSLSRKSQSSRHKSTSSNSHRMQPSSRTTLMKPRRFHSGLKKRESSWENARWKPWIHRSRYLKRTNHTWHYWSGSFLASAVQRQS